MSDDQKLDWFCGGNIPGPFSTLEELEEFVADNREGADRLPGMASHIQQAEEHIWYLKEIRDGRIARPKANSSTEELQGLIAQLQPLAASNIAAREDLELALGLLNDMRSGGLE